MNRTHRWPTRIALRILFALAALGLFFQAAAIGRAQDRWLMIFETSAAMKKRMPAVITQVQKLFFTSVGGELHSEDSLGVWTFDQKLHVGEFPLSTWAPDQAANTSSNLVAFLNKRTFKGAVNFNALEPVLSEVVTGSHRLTILIFCEGQGDIIWTPYNEEINHTLRQNYAERKKSNQPFVIVLRVQDGKYFGCSVNFPPGALNLPMFPPPPVEPKPEVVASPASEPAKKKTEPLDNSPLIVSGKSTGTNNPASTAVVPAKSETAPATNLAAPLILSNRPPTLTNATAAQNNATQMVSVVAPAVMANTSTPAMVASALTTNAPPAAASTEKTSADSGYRFLVITGALAFILALGLMIFLILRARQPHGSLITDSLNAPRSPPLRK